MVARSITETGRKPCILFVINSIGSGGAERALDTILRARPDRYRVHLATLDDEPEMRVLPALDGRHCLNAGGSLGRSIIGLRSLVRRLKPDLVVSLLVRANLANLLAGTGGRSIVCERMHLSSHLSGRYHGPALLSLRLAVRILYPGGACILAVSEGVRRDLVDTFGVPVALTRTINNPYDLDRITREGQEEPDVDLPANYIVAVGRLVAAKGFSDLIEAYRRARLDAGLVILGEGPEKRILEQQIQAAGLSDRILLPGFVPRPFSVMKRARFLVSASHNEGFPNAIAEAMALCVPVIATDCPSGPAELLGACAGEAGSITAAAHGLLVGDGDVEALATAMTRLDGDAGLRAHYAKAGRARMEDFKIEDIAARYWTLFEATLAKNVRR